MQSKPSLSFCQALFDVTLTKSMIGYIILRLSLFFSQRDWHYQYLTLIVRFLSHFGF